MTDLWTNRWDERYSSDEFAYGRQPNKYLKEQLTQLKPGSILFAAEGEGRNAVFAASLGWQASAFDISNEGRKKAMQLANEYEVSINYQVGELQTLQYQNEQFDCIALIYAHFPPAIKHVYHKLLNNYLRVGGTIIFEAFSKKHLDYLAVNDKIGGPKDLDSLFSIEEISADFPEYEIKTLTETEINLSEGLYHNGKGSVIRFVGRKIK